MSITDELTYLQNCLILLLSNLIVIRLIKVAFLLCNIYIA